MYKTFEKIDFVTKLFFDEPNKRLRVVNYRSQNLIKLIEFLLDKASELNYSKIWLVCRDNDWIEFLSRGFVLEGAADGYFKGDRGYFMSYFFKGGRQLSENYEKEQIILKEVLSLETDMQISAVDSAYRLRQAEESDVNQLTNLFKLVFETYPVPVTDPAYLKRAMSKSNLFYVIEHEGKVISAASADINMELGNAELTDCATFPEYRGKNLMSHLIRALEEALYEKEIYFLYSLARAMSPGIGKVFRKLGFQYRGRLINNCNICGSFEDMNLWTKYRLTSLGSEIE